MRESTKARMRGLRGHASMAMGGCASALAAAACAVLCCAVLCCALPDICGRPPCGCVQCALRRGSLMTTGRSQFAGSTERGVVSSPRRLASPSSMR